MFAKKTICILSAGAILAAAGAPVLADHYDRYSRHEYAERYVVRNGAFRHSGLTPSERDMLSNFQSEANYRRYVHELAVKYGVSYADIERMARTPEPQGPAFHEPTYGNYPIYGDNYYRGQPQPAYAPVYAPEPVYAPAYAPERVYAPAPVYVERRDNTAAILGGAALGAALGSQIGDRNTRPAAMAFGAVFGAILGNELSDR